MKIYAYEVREDEQEYLEKIAKKLKVEIMYTTDTLNMETIDNASAYDGITTLGQSKISDQVLDELKKRNILYCATRTIGYNHIDINHAKEIGIKVCNANYDPNGVADYTVMLILMSIRRYKQALWRGQVNDYSLIGLQGKEMRNLTIGIIGTGRIGNAVIKNLTGFGCRILAYDAFQNDKTKEYAQYVGLDILYKESDVISIHTPLLDSTYHMINTDTLGKMKDGVVLINCARGELMDNKALIYGIESKKIGALALDVVEREEGIYHHDRRVDIIKNQEMAYLRQFPNVIMTQHMAFYTDAAVKSMVECAVIGLNDLFVKGTCNTEIK
ncbi:D-isomer specific 2-hydroxyacid dehydrogenase family protein [Clostridium oryzae]|uniref:Phenyllactate dehydrogenase n=1 Tax=Clostridium oryzae TaxID=1450648 RepID=A0A1V4IFC9_9CLOT|nr:D-isomer specific 2-hydroxyacid dehydrogenase family protein [Clostridium oryzae]OPJ58560.1 phenyllactate dehydrogenase [Clostridium oryzae]